MKGLSGASSGETSEAALRSPGQLALALPLIAILALMAVVSATALGGSSALVAIVAVAGLALCAIAPMALIDLFVARPLRAAAQRLRATRDGRPVERRLPFAFGVVADLVYLAEDIRLAQDQERNHAATLAQAEKLIAAGDEAIRAFRQHSQELAEATALGESQVRSASQSQFAEIADALKSLRESAAPAGLGGAVERLESMLVYLGEALERREANDKAAEGAFGRVEQSLSDLAEAARQMREDMASAAPNEAAEARVIARIESAEARVMAQLEDPALADTIRAEAEATRQALAAPRGEAKLGALAALGDLLARNVARLEAVAPGAGPEALGEAVAKGVADLGERLDAIEQRVVQQFLSIERDAEATTLTTLLRTTKQLGEALQKLEALSGAAKAAPVEALRAELQALGAREEAGAQGLKAEIATLGERLSEVLAQAKAGDQDEARREAESAQFEALREALQRIEASLAEADGKIGQGATHLAEIAARDEGEAARRAEAEASMREALQRIEAAVAEPRWEQLAARLGEGEAARHSQAEASMREALRRVEAAVAEPRWEQLAARLGEGEAARHSQAEASMHEALQRIEAAAAEADDKIAARTQARWEELAARFGEGSAQLAEIAARGTLDFDALRHGVERIAAAASQAAADASAAPALDQDALEAALQSALGAWTQAATARLDEQMEAIRRERFDPAVTAIQTVAREFGKAGAQLSGGAEALDAAAAADRPAFAAVREDIAAIAAALAALIENSAARPPEGETAREIAALGAKLEGLATQPASEADFASRFEAFAAEQNERLAALDVRLSARAAGLDRTSVAAALTVFRNMTRNLAQAVERLQAATATVEASTAREGESDEAALRDELRAAGEAVSGAATRLDSLAEAQAQRLEALEVKLLERDASEERAAADSALTALRELSRDLSEAVAAFQAPPPEGPSTPELSQQLADFAQAQNERLDGLELRLAARNVSLDRNVLASALTALRGLGQALQDATARFESATETIRSGDLANDLGGRLDAFAAAQQQAIDDLGHRLPDAAGLRDDVRAVAAKVGELPAELAQSLESATAPALRAEFDRFGERLAAALEERARREAAEAAPGRSKSASETNTSGAVAKIVVSLADSLDFRFTQIEHSLADLAARTQSGAASPDVSEQMNSVLKQIYLASNVLKSNLSDFIGVSAALAENGDVRNRTLGQLESKEVA